MSHAVRYDSPLLKQPAWAVYLETTSELVLASRKSFDARVFANHFNHA